MIFTIFIITIPTLSDATVWHDDNICDFVIDNFYVKVNDWFFALQKWQRRFFILYEHGLLRYALDEMVRKNFLQILKNRLILKNNFSKITSLREHNI